MLQVVAYLSLPQDLYPVFFPFLGIFKSEFLIQDLISELIANENETSIYQNLSLGVDNQKQINTCSMKQPDLYYFETIKMTSQA